MKNLLYILFLMFTFSCTSNNEIQRLQAQVDSLKLENEELRFGEERLTGLIDFSLENNKYVDAEEYIIKLRDKHPESKRLGEYVKKLPTISLEAKRIRDARNKAIQDSIFLANINEMGIWGVGRYVNEFDEPTGEHYVYGLITGYFSNSATAHSDLLVKMIFRKDYYDDLEAYIEYDEYANGVADGAGWGDWELSKIVCKERKIIYKPKWGGKWENTSTSEEVKILDALLMNDVLECKIYNREERAWYYFTIDTNYLKNALLKAKLITL